MLQDIFISKVRVDILHLLVLHPEDSYHIRGIVRIIGAEINAVRRELNRLERINLLTKRQSGNRIYYTVNTTHPFYSDLLSMIAKEYGLGNDIITNAKELGNIKYAVLSKGFLRGRVSSPLDVDLFIVGEVNVNLLKQIVSKHEVKVKKEINYSVMSYEEFMHRKRKLDNFVTKILTQNLTTLVGDEKELGSLV